MANGLERLERLFAYKRKASPTPGGRANSAVQATEQQFPSPSFIRPKTSRMTARDEVRWTQAAGRSPSVPDIATSPPTAHRQAHNSVTTGCNHPPKGRSCRSPFFTQRNIEQLITGLCEFQFPAKSGLDSEPLPTSPILDAPKFCVPPLPTPRGRSLLEISVPISSRLDTPPTSDDGSQPTSPRGKGPQIPLPACPPTPGQSPDLGPVADIKLRNVKSADALDRSLFKGIESQLGEPFDDFSLSRSYSQSSLAHSAHSFCSSTLREPDFNEFLNLSDDDIAESTPDSPALEPLEDVHSTPPLMNLSMSSSSSQPAPCALLTLTPPRASRPAAAAAFEAARIARRYDFDLVYVVNLWPDTSRQTSGYNLNSRVRPMIGRLLAAHGLHHVPSPLQISTQVHTQVLKSDGWIEYQNQDAQPHDLARGFSCAFYTGQYARGSSSRSASPVSGVRLSERIDRGIVFAAYRKPQHGQDRLGRNFSEEELGELHRDAEVLVEMVIDIHVANRSRQPRTRTSLTDETGPIPLQTLVEVA
ncbi:uncharacterized protein MAM_06831 [Metarhizium album ARSEF 1941]|uniref:Uncharacterized protein n=1 Tax=Metarhizium album (strain ARSEF 1941) TaxID=1081103 RepID=A0A0B2WPD2_METAS|nr:uncharacterized protein MAM_06831 [Metarhizium album ARSEF 1941]KHN95327.1 hypothetical protein MAM_06831 [Metarhizium album ARSEF 1941]